MSHGHAKGPAHTGHARAAHSSDGSTWVQYAQMDACVFTSSSLSVAELSVSSARAARGTFAGREWSSCVEGMREAAWMEAVLRAAAAARCSAVRRSRSSSTRRFVLAIVDTFARGVGTRFWHCRVGGPGKFGRWRVAHRLLMGGPCRRGVRVDARRRGAPRGRKPEAGRLGPRGSRETMCSRYGLRVYGRRSLSSWARPTQLESVIGKAGHGVRLGVTATWLM